MVITKDPAAVLDYGFNWTDWLAAGDSVSVSNWAVPGGSGLTIGSSSIDGTGKITTVWLSGGTASPSPYRVTNTITTASGRTDKRSLMIQVTPR